jgi:hypothetical protein
VSRDQAVDGLDRALGVRRRCRACATPLPSSAGSTEKRDRAARGARGGGGDDETVAAGERGELGLTFGERFEEQKTRCREMPARPQRPRPVGGADVDPRADGNAPGGGAGEQAVHLEGTVAAREVEAEGMEQAVGGVTQAGT